MFDPKVYAFGLLLLFSVAPARAGTTEVLAQDLQQILTVGSLDSAQVSFTWTPADFNRVEVTCNDNKTINLRVSSLPDEEVSTFYYGVHKLGFLFPHPRKQLSPQLSELLKKCGKSWTWRPSLKARGFHFHTQHPNEWVSGFYEGNDSIARDSILWMARNFQNRLQLQLIKGSLNSLGKRWWPLYTLMKDLQIKMGLSIGLSSQQQRAVALIPLFNALTGIDDEVELNKSLARIAQKIPFDYVSLEFGTSEFTATNFENTIRWLSTACQTLKSMGKSTYAVSHVSTGQTDPKLGNYNFLTQYVDSCLGSYIHTVMAYGLQDHYTPVYGRQNFSDLLDFAGSQKTKREVLYFPETSYFIGMDIDVPILLTDYLVARAADYQWAAQNDLDGHIDFSTGQELGYWLLDWTVALNANQEYLGDPYVGLRLLGEDLAAWKPILDFQTKYFKDQQLIQYLSTSNLLDEIDSKLMIHKRTLLRDLHAEPQELHQEIEHLSDAIRDEPNLNSIKNPELRAMLSITWRRIEHAFALRKAIENPKDKALWLDSATIAHQQAALEVEELLPLQRYLNDSLVFEKRNNPTSYGYGYGWVATQLFFWSREEEIVRKNESNPFFMNIYNPFKLLF